ncbi:unnamed protein product [Adineta ricciae]|uniref:E3 SUMO-protein ligase NSE2 n=1 Tax=Adineta ricciae TaxID=249248 RepID=A0A814BDX8_ADIRI|nr:unnamed protein product [Adineta ricciae]
MIEKQIATLTSVAQEMQECPESQKYVDALMKIAVRVNDVEEKATKCIKEARTQLKKTKLVDKQNEKQKKVRHSNSDDEEDDSEDEMEIDESQIGEQIEIPALTSESLEKLQNQIHKVLIKQPDPNAFNLDSDNRYADFADCISKMENGNDDDVDIVDKVVSNKCPLTQTEFVEPVQNKKCKHKYEKSAVLKYIAEKMKSRRPVKCPYSGCDNVLHEKELIHA